MSGCALAGVRLSAARIEILKLLAGSDVPLVVEEFVREQAARMSTHPVTLYRFLAELQAASVLRMMTVAGRRAVLLACQSANWLICQRCGVVRRLPEPEPMPRWRGELARTTGFRVEHHWYEVVGLCPGCSDGRA